MKVKELIVELQKYDPEMEVYYTGDLDMVSISSVKIGVVSGSIDEAIEIF